MPEDPQGARDYEGCRDKNVGDEMAGDNRVFDLAGWLTDDIFIDWFHTKTAVKTNVPIFFQILEIIALDYNEGQLRTHTKAQQRGTIESLELKCNFK